MYCFQGSSSLSDHTQPLTRTSSDADLREGQRLAVLLWSHPGHHHRHEFPGCSVGSGLCRAPAVLHLLLQRPVVPQHHHAGELQLELYDGIKHKVKINQQRCCSEAWWQTIRRGAVSARELVPAWSKTVNGPHTAIIGLISDRDCWRITGSIEASCGQLNESESWSIHINLMTFHSSKRKL